MSFQILFIVPAICVEGNGCNLIWNPECEPAGRQCVVTILIPLPRLCSAPTANFHDQIILPEIVSVLVLFVSVQTQNKQENLM